MTPEEIQAEWDAFIDYPEGSGKLYVTTTSALIFARTIVATAMSRANLEAVRGSPVVAGEPQPSTEGPPELWLQLHGDCAEPELSEPVDYTAGDVTWCWHSIHDSDVRYVRADLTTTPQPTQTQAGAVPLTDEQIDQAIAELGLNYLADAHATNRAVLRKLCHHAHDIKGGQHGADT